MALSGSVTTTSCEDRSLTLNWSATQNVANNTSTISWSLVGSGEGVAVRCGAFNVAIAGVTVLSKSTSEADRMWVSKGTVVASGTLDVLHGNDGTKSFTVSVSAGIYYYAVNCSGSGTFSLNTIARATTPSVSPSTTSMNSNVTINTPRASSSFTHNLYYYFGNASGTIATGVATSYSWKIPLDLAKQIPNSTSGVGTIRCQTYNGGTLIGTKDVTFTATVPSNVVPSITSVTITDPTGVKDIFDEFVQGNSQAKIQVAASGSYGSTITKISISAFGLSSTVNPYVSNVITVSGSQNISVTITDSRGRTTSSTRSINVLPYVSPTIKKLTASRCDSSGNPDDSGSYMRISYSGIISHINNLNSKQMVLKYKGQGMPDWIVVFSHDVYEENDSVIVPADVDSSFDISYEISDSFTSVPRTWTVSTAFTLMDFNRTGKGVAIGKVSEKNAFEVNMDMFVNGKIKVKEENVLLKFAYVTTNIASGSFASYSSNVGGYYAYITINTSDYHNIKAIFPVGVYDSSGGQGYDGLVNPTNMAEAGLICTKWTVTIKTPRNMTAGFIIVYTDD